MIKFCVGLRGSVVRAIFDGIVFLPSYRTRDFLDERDSNSLIMKGHPKTLSDVDDFLAEERFYE